MSTNGLLPYTLAVLLSLATTLVQAGCLAQVQALQKQTCHMQCNYTDCVQKTHLPFARAQIQQHGRTTRLQQSLILQTDDMLDVLYQ